MMTGLLGGLVLTALICTIWYYLRSRPAPEELERLRRLAVNEKGKICEGVVVDVNGLVIVYSYHVAGMEYTASQDLAVLPDLLTQSSPPQGSVSIKYDPRNPANSIVACEEWNGLARMAAHRQRGSERVR